MNDPSQTDQSGSPGSGKKPFAPLVNLGLFLATLLTTYTSGVAFAGTANPAMAGLYFCGTLMTILLFHEFGHYVMARRNKVPTSLPFFIPVPFGIGTLGAIIVMRGRIRSRDALMEVGAAGPLAGLLVAIPALYWGLSLSTIGPMPQDAESILLGESLLFAAVKWLVYGPISNDLDVYLHPMAWAAWIGFLVTMINLMPIGQLDGGHIFYALFGSAHRRMSRLFHSGLFLFGASITAYFAIDALNRGLTVRDPLFWMRVSSGLPWFVWGFVLFLLGWISKKGLDHPPTDEETLSPRNRIVGYLCLVLFAATFVPVPQTIAL